MPGHILSPETDLPFLNQWKGENDHRKYFMIKSPWKNVAALAGFNPQPPDYQLDAQPTEPPRVDFLIKYSLLRCHLAAICNGIET